MSYKLPYMLRGFMPVWFYYVLCLVVSTHYCFLCDLVDNVYTDLACLLHVNSLIKAGLR
jgi:hypothetical protein